MVYKALVIGGAPLGDCHPPALMAKALAESGFHVLYVRRWGSVAQDLAHGSLIGAQRRLIQARHKPVAHSLTPTLSEICLRGLPSVFPIAGPLSHVQARVIANQVTPWLRVTPGELIVFLYWWFVPDLKRLLKPRYVLFDVIDNHLNYASLKSGLRSATLREMQRTIAVSDASLAISPGIQADFYHHGWKTVLAPNALCLEGLGSEYSVTQIGNAGVLAGYWGGVNGRVDGTILRDLSLSRDIRVDLVGGYLPKLSQVRCLGPLPHSRMSDIMSTWHVGLIPFVANDFTNAIDPLKLREYLYMGLPVVSTGLRTVNAYANEPFFPPKTLYVAEPEQFPAMVLRAARENHPTYQTLRRQWALSYTWRDRVHIALSALGL